MITDNYQFMLQLMDDKSCSLCQSASAVQKVSNKFISAGYNEDGCRLHTTWIYVTVFMHTQQILLVLATVMGR